MPFLCIFVIQSVRFFVSRNQIRRPTEEIELSPRMAGQYHGYGCAANASFEFHPYPWDCSAIRGNNFDLVVAFGHNQSFLPLRGG
jgi:hypothetical protein